jgi:ABC-2 type transport system permease protein
MKDLAHKLRIYWRIIWKLQKNNLMTTAAYKQNFVIMAIAVVIYMSLSIIFMKVVFSYIKNIAGWNYYEVLIIIGTVMIIEGVLWVFTALVGALGRQIRKGLLDGTIIKPLDTQFLISIWECDHEDIPRIIIGGALVLYGLSNLHIGIHAILPNLFFYLILLFNATIIYYSLVLILKTTFFWTIVDFSVHNVIEAVSEVSKYPSDIFTSIYLRSVFTVLLPLAFVATVPAKVLARGFDWKLVLGSFLITAIFFTLARKFWLYALNHYQSASS